MPRGKKKVAPVENLNVAAEETSVSEKKARKPYPSREERVIMADAKIAQLQKLNAEREVLVALTEAKLNKRKEALAKSTAALEKTIAKKAKIIANGENPGQSTRARTAKQEEKQLFQELKDALKAKGMSVTDLLKEIKVD